MRLTAVNRCHPRMKVAKWTAQMMTEASEELWPHCRVQWFCENRCGKRWRQDADSSYPTGLLSTAKFRAQRKCLGLLLLFLLLCQLASALSQSQLYARNRWSSLKESVEEGVEAETQAANSHRAQNRFTVALILLALEWLSMSFPYSYTFSHTSGACLSLLHSSFLFSCLVGTEHCHDCRRLIASCVLQEDSVCFSACDLTPKQRPARSQWDWKKSPFPVNKRRQPSRSTARRNHRLMLAVREARWKRVSDAGSLDAPHHHQQQLYICQLHSLCRMPCQHGHAYRLAIGDQWRLPLTISLSLKQPKWVRCCCCSSTTSAAPRLVDDKRQHCFWSSAPYTCFPPQFAFFIAVNPSSCCCPDNGARITTTLLYPLLAQR